MRGQGNGGNGFGEGRVLTLKTPAPRRGGGGGHPPGSRGEGGLRYERGPTGGGRASDTSRVAARERRERGREPAIERVLDVFEDLALDLESPAAGRARVERPARPDRGQAGEQARDVGGHVGLLPHEEHDRLDFRRAPNEDFQMPLARTDVPPAEPEDLGVVRRRDLAQPAADLLELFKGRDLVQVLDEQGAEVPPQRILPRFPPVYTLRPEASTYLDAPGGIREVALLVPEGVFLGNEHGTSGRVVAPVRSL